MSHDRRDEPVTGAHAASVSLRFALSRQWIRWRCKFISERELMGWAALEASFPMLPVEIVLIPLIRLRPAAAGHLVLFTAVLPLPLSIISIGAVFLQIGLIPFLLTVLIARGLRFYLVTSLTVHFNTGKMNVRTKR